MDGVLKAVQRLPLVWKERAKTAQQEQNGPEREEKERVLADIRMVCAKIRSVQSRFEQVSDGDLVASCIYELEALNAKYRFLLGQAKRLGITKMPFASKAG